MMNSRPPSSAQARRLAALFAFNGEVQVSEAHMTATDRTLVQRGWVTNTGECRTYPNGAAFWIWKINASGLAALENYLRNLRTPGSAG